MFRRVARAAFREVTVVAEDRKTEPPDKAQHGVSLHVVGLDELLLVLALSSLLLALHVRWTSGTPFNLSLRSDRDALSPNGSLLATTSLYTCGVFDLEKGRFLYLLPDKVCSLEFSKDGRMLLLAEPDGVVKLLEARTGRRIRTWKVSSPPPSRARFHPDGDLIAALGEEGPIELWSCTDAQLLREIDPQLKGIVDIYFAERAGLLCVDGWDGTEGDVLQLWNVRTARLHESVRIPPGRDLDVDLAVSPDGNKVVMVFDNPPLLRLWDVPTGTLSTLMPIPEVQSIRDGQRTARVDRVKFSRTGRYVFLELFEDHAALWDFETGSLKEAPWECECGKFVQFLDQDTIVAIGDGDHVEFRDVETTELLREVDPPVLLLKHWGSGRRQDWLGFAVWLAFWFLAYRRRRRHPERPTGRRDRGVFLLPFVAGVWVVKGELIAAVVKGSGRLISLDLPEALQFLPAAGVFTLLLAPGLFSILILLLGLTRRFRSRLIFTVPSLVIAAWTIFGAPPRDVSVWTLLVFNLR